MCACIHLGMHAVLPGWSCSSSPSLPANSHPVGCRSRILPFHPPHYPQTRGALPRPAQGEPLPLPASLQSLGLARPKSVTLTPSKGLRDTRLNLELGVKGWNFLISSKGLRLVWGGSWLCAWPAWVIMPGWWRLSAFRNLLATLVTLSRCRPSWQLLLL